MRCGSPFVFVPGVAKFWKHLEKERIIIIIQREQMQYLLFKNVLYRSAYSSCFSQYVSPNKFARHREGNEHVHVTWSMLTNLMQTKVSWWTLVCFHKQVFFFFFFHLTKIHLKSQKKRSTDEGIRKYNIRSLKHELVILFDCKTCHHVFGCGDIYLFFTLVIFIDVFFFLCWPFHQIFLSVVVLLISKK